MRNLLVNSVSMVLVSACAAAGVARAGTICRSTAFAGYEEQAAHAAASLGGSTSDPMATRIYTERVRGVYYYQTNYLEPGARYPAKLLSGERLTLGEVLANLIYASAGEARRNRARTAAMAQRVVVLAGTAEAGPMFAADRVGGARIDLADAGLDLTGTP